MFEILPKKIQQKAAEYGCKDYIMPVEKIIKCPLETLKNDVNLAIGSYRKWKLVVDSKTKAELKGRTEVLIDEWASMLSFDELESLLTVQKSTFMKSKYLAKAEAVELRDNIVNDINLILIIYKTRNMSELFTIRISFTHPQTLSSLRKSIESEKDELAKLKQSCRISLYAAGLLALLLLILLLFLLGKHLLGKRKRAMTIAELNNQIEMREELINNGHYVAALELADRFLQYFPNNVEIKAFRERLMDFTNDDTKKAQIAFVEAKKLQARLKNPQLGNYLSASDKENLANLLPYHPQLKESYTKLIAIEDEGRKQIEFQGKFDLVLSQFRQKNISTADQELKQLEAIYYDKEEIQNLRKEINHVSQKSSSELNMIIQQLPEKELQETISRLDALLQNHQDFKPALDFQESLQDARLKSGFSLISPLDQEQIDVFCKKEIIIGRSDDNLKLDIAIEDKHVSRPHLKVVFDDGAICLEDLNSSGGTYVKGEKIEKQKISNNEIVTLAKIVDLNLQFYRKEQGKIGAVLLSTKSRQSIILDTEIGFQIKQARLDLRNPKYKIILRERLAILVAASGAQLLTDDKSIQLHGIDYQIKFF